MRTGAEQPGHSWFPGPQVGAAVIMSIKTNKFKMYGERRKKGSKIAKTLALFISIATCFLTLRAMGPGLGRERTLEEAGDGWWV